MEQDQYYQSFVNGNKFVQKLVDEVPPPIGAIPIGIPEDFIEFNKMIGNPLHPATLEKCALTDYQTEYEQMWTEKHKLLVNKARKIGATDLALRVIAHKCFFEYVGHNVMIVAGNRQAQANIFLDRLDDLFHGPNDQGWKLPNGETLTYDKLVLHKSSSLMELKHGVQIRTFPALPTALRGMENIKCVFISEAAHVNRLDDSKVYTALRPITSNDPDVDFILESTPNGRRGFFYDLWKRSDEFHHLEIPYKRALGTVLSEKDVLQLKKDPKINFAQEYECQF